MDKFGFRGTTLTVPAMVDQSKLRQLITLFTSNMPWGAKVKVLCAD